MLHECWMKVCIVCTCRPTSFIQHASPLTFSFNVQSKITTDMLLPVILSELVDSADEKLRQVKTREWIIFLNLYFFSVAFVYFLWSACLLFFRYLQLLLLHLSILSPCSCNLDRWSEFLCCCWRSFRFDVYRCMIFYCYDFFFQSVLVLLNHSKFEVLTFEMTSQEWNVG